MELSLCSIIWPRRKTVGINNLFVCCEVTKIPFRGLDWGFENVYVPLKTKIFLVIIQKELVQLKKLF